MSLMSSGSSSSTLHVEKTAAAPSTPNSSLACLGRLVNWKLEWGRDLTIQIDKLLTFWDGFRHFCISSITSSMVATLLFEYTNYITFR